jgi:hypothetical protein
MVLGGRMVMWGCQNRLVSFGIENNNYKLCIQPKAMGIVCHPIPRSP